MHTFKILVKHRNSFWLEHGCGLTNDINSAHVFSKDEIENIAKLNEYIKAALERGSLVLIPQK